MTYLWNKCQNILAFQTPIALVLTNTIFRERQHFTYNTFCRMTNPQMNISNNLLIMLYNY